jgi:molybdopterin-guanine dinucleotide biosynthesis protein A/rhodanese-related sulfurtransferase
MAASPDAGDAGDRAVPGALTGAVLTGGRSRRMGRDKALVPVDGTPMVRRAADALASAGASPVVCIGGDAARLVALGLVVVPDRWPGEGPLGGLASALAVAPPGRVLVAGCDQPWLDPAVLRRLVGAAGESTAAVFRVGGRRQPLPGLYATTLADRLAAAVDAGARRLGDALDLASCVLQLDLDDPASLRDVDRPRDLPGGTLPQATPTLEVPVEVSEIDVDTLAERQGPGSVIIDVRMPDEYVEGHVAGARLIPLPEVPDRLAEVPTDQPVLVICKSGGRSLRATEFYVAQGIDATNVAGGTMAWIESGRAVVTGDQPG